MGNTDKLNELIERRAEIEQGGGESAIKNAKANGQMTARERINILLDDQSFVEIGAFVTHRTTNFNMEAKNTPSDGVVTGYGTIEGKLVYVYSQDVTVLGGALGEMHAKKICNVYDLAIKMGAPVIGVIDSAGIRLQESTDALEGFGEIFLKQTLASGVIPQITAVVGNCGGGAAVIPALSDFSFMTTTNASLYVNSPNALDSKDASFDTIASAKYQSETTGTIDFVYETEEELFVSIRKLVELLPSNNMDGGPIIECTDDLNRVSSDLNNIDSQSSVDGIDSKYIIGQIADAGSVLEVSENFAKDVITAFVTLNGSTVGIVGNQTTENDGKLTSKGCLKISKFVKICNAFDIPIVTLTDVTGYTATVKEEASMSKSVGDMLYNFANASVPKVNVLIGRGYGSAYIAMNSKHIGADFVYAWPSSKVSMMDATSAVKIMYSEEITESKDADVLISEKTAEFEANQASPYAAASRGYIDDIIEPAATRKRVIAALDMLYTKRVNLPHKKHGTI